MSAISAPRPAVSNDVTEQLLELYWERAYRFAAMITRNQHESADIAQEALLKVLRQLDRFDPGRGSFDSWLWRIVLNIARDAGRAASRQQALIERLQSLGRIEEGPNAEVVALQHISDERLLGAVHRLRKLPRTLIALRFGAHLSYREIGEQMGMTEAAALMATRRALAFLRKDVELKEALR
jgi:RNA polymerase sigma-70 factor (ECF subfamily)